MFQSRCILQVRMKYNWIQSEFHILSLGSIDRDVRTFIAEYRTLRYFTDGFDFET